MHSPAATNGSLVTVTSFSTPVVQPQQQHHHAPPHHHHHHHQQGSSYPAYNSVQSQPGAYPFHHRVGPFSTSVASSTSGPQQQQPHPPQQARRGGRFRGSGSSAHYTTWDPTKLYNNMSQYNSNPVGALQERFQSRGITPQYRVVQAEGASHCPTFSFQVFVEEYVAMGSGSSKKQAKHNAARAMLDKLDGRAPAQDGLQPLPAVSGISTANNNSSNATDDSSQASAPSSSCSTNTIGQLQELCVHKGLPMPVYDLESVEGQPHQRSFVLKVNVGSIQVTGEGTSKKDAKRDAAAKMIKNVQVLAKQQAQETAGVDKDGAGDVKVKKEELTPEEEELAKKLKNLKIDTLTTKNSQKIQHFWKDLQENVENSSKLFVLHRTPLKSHQGDYVVMLTDVSQEQNFEVTYVEIEDRSDSGDLQCLVQLSTMPVAVCYGTGKDKTSANQEAARNALNYIKMMTKKTAVSNGK